MKIHNIEQGTKEWFRVRMGKLTASHATAIAANGAGLDTYVQDIVLNMIAYNNGKERKHFQNEHTKRGHELEPYARKAFQLKTGLDVKEVGFVEFNGYVGFSPDGIIFNKKQGAEIKCRDDAKHYKILRTGKISSATIWQIQMSMLLSGFDSWYFISYNEDFKQSLFIKLIERDFKMQEKLINGLESGISKLKEVMFDPATIKEFE